MSALNFRIWQRQTASLGPQKYSHIAPIHHICNEGVASRSASAFANVIIAYILIIPKKSECHLRIKCRQYLFFVFGDTHILLHIVFTFTFTIHIYMHTADEIDTNDSLAECHLLLWLCRDSSIHFPANNVYIC